MPKSLLLPACFSRGKLDPTGCQCHQRPPPPPSSLVIQSHLPSSQECTPVILSSPPSLFSPGPRCPRQSGGSVRLVVPYLFILSGETGYGDLLCVRRSLSQAPVWLSVRGREPARRRGRGLWGWTGDEPRTGGGQGRRRETTRDLSERTSRNVLR